MQTKNTIRAIYKQRRLDLSVSEKEKMDDLILIQFQQLLIDIPSFIMTYVPIQKLGEFDPQVITDYCYFKNPMQQLFYPIMTETDGEPDLDCVIVNDETLFAKNKFGIDEPVDGLEMFPEEIDLVIVPLLSFDRKGNRVGYGKGYYDRFLKQCGKECIKIGFSYFEPVDKISDIKRYDKKMNYCITPERVYEF